MRGVVRRGLGEMASGSAPLVLWTLRIVVRVARIGRGSFPERLLTLHQALFALKGVLDDLAGRKVAGAVMVRSGFGQLLRELPQRFVRWPTSRGFGGHLSTAGPFALVPSWPAAAARLWARAAQRVWV